MIKIYSFLLFLVFQCLSGYSQFVGFKESECGIIDNPHYWFVNWDGPEHSFSYYLYHDGVIIRNTSTSGGGGSQAMELRFVDDTTGIFIEFILGGMMNVYKILNDSVIFLGGSVGFSYDLFVVSRHTFYFVTSFPWLTTPVELNLSRFSDLTPVKSLVTDTAFIADTVVYDTVLGIPFCPGINEIHYGYKTSTDTIQYTIIFSVDTLISVPLSDESCFEIFPNPASDVIHIRPVRHTSNYTVRIFDISGRMRISREINMPEETSMSISDFEKGVYFVAIENSNSRIVSRIIKI